jgi:hypothetical protein
VILLRTLRKVPHLLTEKLSGRLTFQSKGGDLSVPLFTPLKFMAAILLADVLGAYPFLSWVPTEELGSD